MAWATTTRAPFIYFREIGLTRHRSALLPFHQKAARDIIAPQYVIPLFPACDAVHVHGDSVVLTYACCLPSALTTAKQSQAIRKETSVCCAPLDTFTLQYSTTGGHVGTASQYPANSHQRTLVRARSGERSQERTSSTQSKAPALRCFHEKAFTVVARQLPCRLTQ